VQEEEPKKIKKVCNIKFTVNSPCPCGSGNKYKKCCQPFHKGKLTKSALELMRSRYCAFAHNNPKYIIHTTHPNNPDFTENTKSWLADIQNFSHSCIFENLQILDFIPDLAHKTIIIPLSKGFKFYFRHYKAYTV